jgi:hypothetical protein
LIAEEVATVYPELVTRASSGEVQTVRYQQLIPLLLNELQRQGRDFRHQREAIAQQQREIAELRSMLVEGEAGSSAY